MALKDWKKIINERDYFEFKNKDDFRWVSIGLNHLSKIKGKKWNVSGNRINTRYFKTKALALKYIKSYMKKK